MNLRDSALWIAVGAFALHLLTATGYGIFRDEFYYLACADHLAWGYVDHPPLSIALLGLWRGVFGDGMVALRIPPALLHAFAVFATGRLARNMGARGLGVALAATCTALAPGLLGMTSFYSMNALDLAFWTGLVWVAQKILVQSSPRLWILFGVLLGLGLMNKVSAGMLGAGLAAGLLLTPARREFRTPWPWVAGAIAVLVFLPHVLWQVAHDWPTREFIANAQRYKIAQISPAGFLKESWLTMSPLSILVWLPGLIALLFYKPLARFRAFGVAWVVVLAVLLLRTSKPYYLNAAYPMLFAAGGVFWTRLALRRWGRWLSIGALACIVASGLFLTPFSMPVLSPARFTHYSDFLGMEAKSGENSALGVLPQHFADRFGWKELAADVAAVYAGLSPEERAHCLIVGSNYGEAGALLYYRDEYGLPRAASQHNNFYLWGTGGHDFEAVIVIGQTRENLETVFDSVEEAAVHDHPLAMPYESNLPIFVCRGLKLDFDTVWKSGRRYI